MEVAAQGAALAGHHRPEHGQGRSQLQHRYSLLWLVSGLISACVLEIAKVVDVANVFMITKVTEIAKVLETDKVLETAKVLDIAKVFETTKGA